MHLLEMEPHDGPHGLRWDELEVDRHPIAPLAHLQDELGFSDFELDRRLLRVQIDRERKLDLLLFLQERIVGAEQRGLDRVVVRIDLVDLTAADVVALESKELGGEERERPRGSQQVGRAHTAQLSRRLCPKAGSWRGCE